ncbi:MAG: diguanylate cyclase [Pseudomonadota bacterium]
MLGLINQGLRSFVLAFHGEKSWSAMRARRAELPEDFEVLLDYPPDITTTLLAEIAMIRDVDRRDVLEDLGTYLVTNLWEARIRDLILTCGADFNNFMARAPVILQALEQIEPRSNCKAFSFKTKAKGQYEIRNSGDMLYAAPLIVGVLRAIADHFGALVTLKHKQNKWGGHAHNKFELTVFEAGHGIGGSKADMKDEDFRNFFRAELLQIILEEARHALARVEDARHRESTAADQDLLTGLINRRGLEKWWNTVGEQAASCAVCLIDLDDFKSINDNYGHHIGDKVLQVLGQRLNHVMRTGDAVSRLGGDEFLVVFPAETAKKALETCKRLLSISENNICVGTLNLPFGLSLGCVFKPPQTEMSLKSLQNVADVALYTAKSAGKNRYALRSLDVTMTEPFKQA